VSEPHPFALRDDPAKLAFWCNAYNDLVRGELAARPRRGHLFRHRRLFGTLAVELGGQRFTPDEIEHGILRRNARPPYGLRPLLRAGDPRLALAPDVLDPRVHFALNCGARSCPPIRRYEEAAVDEQLAFATRAYLEAETRIDRAGGVVRLPYLMKLYRADFPDQRAFAQAHLGEDLAGLRVRHGRFDWRMA
jgi:hypothetical protein